MFTEDDIKQFWCCLNPIERNAITWLHGAAVPPEGYVSKTVADAYFTTIGLDTPLSRKTYLLWSWDFSEGEVEVPILGPIPVYVWNLVQLFELDNFRENDGFACSQKCFVLRYSD